MANFGQSRLQVPRVSPFPVNCNTNDVLTITLFRGIALFFHQKMEIELQASSRPLLPFLQFLIGIQHQRFVVDGSDEPPPPIPGRVWYPRKTLEAPLD